jgi:hypothetical protein
LAEEETGAAEEAATIGATDEVGTGWAMEAAALEELETVTIDEDGEAWVLDKGTGTIGEARLAAVEDPSL